MEIVAGLTLKNLRPRVWHANTEEHVARVTAVMVSFDEFRQRPRLTTVARERGLCAALGIESLDSTRPRVYLDNGAFACLRRGDEPAMAAYCEFVAATRPDWYPVPADFIPLPTFSRRKQRRLFDRTLAVMEEHAANGFCPVIHPGPWLDRYLEALHRRGQTQQLALGGLVPHLLSSEGAQRKATIALLCRIRREFPGRIHAFGLGGVITLHLGAALGVDSADSSGWRQRAARGLVMLRGRGERQAVALGNWKGRALSDDEWAELECCLCRGCRQNGPKGLQRQGINGFTHRAVHNLYTLLEEAFLINRRLPRGDVAEWSLRRMRKHPMRRLIEQVRDEGNR